MQKLTIWFTMFTVCSWDTMKYKRKATVFEDPSQNGSLLVEYIKTTLSLFKTFLFWKKKEL